MMPWREMVELYSLPKEGLYLPLIKEGNLNQLNLLLEMINGRMVYIASYYFLLIKPTYQLSCLSLIDNKLVGLLADQYGCSKK